MPEEEKRMGAPCRDGAVCVCFAGNNDISCAECKRRYEKILMKEEGVLVPADERTEDTCCMCDSKAVVHWPPSKPKPYCQRCLLVSGVKIQERTGSAGDGPGRPASD